MVAGTSSTPGGYLHQRIPPPSLDLQRLIALVDAAGSRVSVPSVHVTVPPVIAPSSAFANAFACALRTLADMIDPPCVCSLIQARCLCSDSVANVHARDLMEVDIEAFVGVFQKYEVRKHHEVVGFLQRFPCLLPVLIEFPAAVESVFGREAGLALDVDLDGMEHGWDQLLVVVRSPFDVDESGKRFCELDGSFWQSRTADVQRQITSLLEFR